MTPPAWCFWLLAGPFVGWTAIAVVLICQRLLG